MKSIVTRLFSLVLVLSFFIFPGCSCIEFFNDEKSEKESSEKESSEKIVTVDTCSEWYMTRFRAIFQETGWNPVIDYSYDSERQIYTNLKLNPYYGAGFKYYNITLEKYNDIQKYQNETGKQVLYPVVSRRDRPPMLNHANDANIFYKFKRSGTTIIPEYDKNGDFIPNYWTHAVDSEPSTIMAEYDSIRIEGESGVNIGGVNYYYVYARMNETGVEVRVFLYEYYEYLKQTRSNDLPTEEQFFGFVEE